MTTGLSCPDSTIPDWTAAPAPEDVRGRELLVVEAGSRTHGTWISPEEGGVDDVDLVAVVVPPVEYYLGLRRFRTKHLYDGPWDVVWRELRETVRLLLNANPNVLPLLWTPPEHVLHAAPEARTLLEARDLFVSRDRAYKAYRGYAASQAKGMAKDGYRGYMGERRKALVDRHGYDVKMAAHTVRLLRMGAEYLRDGRLRVRRKDREELTAIKRGEWSRTRVVHEIVDGEAALKEAYEASPLPAQPDVDGAERALVETVAGFLERREGFHPEPQDMVSPGKQGL